MTFETRLKCLLVSKLIIKQRSTDSFGLFSDPKKCCSHSKSSWTNQIYQNKVVHRVSTNGINFKVRFKLSLGAEKPQTAPLELQRIKDHWICYQWWKLHIISKVSFWWHGPFKASSLRLPHWGILIDAATLCFPH